MQSPRAWPARTSPPSWSPPRCVLQQEEPRRYGYGVRRLWERSTAWRLSLAESSRRDLHLEPALHANSTSRFTRPRPSSSGISREILLVSSWSCTSAAGIPPVRSLPLAWSLWRWRRAPGSDRWAGCRRARRHRTAAPSYVVRERYLRVVPRRGTCHCQHSADSSPRARRWRGCRLSASIWGNWGVDDERKKTEGFHKIAWPARPILFHVGKPPRCLNLWNRIFWLRVLKRAKL